MKSAVLFALLGVASCLEVSMGGNSYLVGPENLVPNGMPVSAGGVTYYVTDADQVAPTQQRMMPMMEEDLLEFSIGGVSYFVEPEFAQTLVGLPASEQIARIQESEIATARQSQRKMMPRMMEGDMQEFSIDGVSYFVEPKFATTLVGLPAAEQIARIQEAEMTRMPRRLNRNMEEFSIDGVSYFVEPEFALSLVGLPASEQIALIQEAETMERMPRTLSRTGNQKEISVGGVSYFVDANLADALVGRPASEQLSLIHGTQRMPRILTRGVAGGNTQEFSIGGVSYFVEPQFAEKLVGLPAAEQLAHLQRNERLQRMMTKRLPRSAIRTRGVRSLAGKQEISIDGRSYFVDQNFHNKLAAMPRVEQLRMLRKIKNGNRGTSYGI